MKFTELFDKKAGGEGRRAYLIAEMSANHGKSIQHAKDIIYAAKEAGADCIKIQTYTPDTMTINCQNPWFQITNEPWRGENLYSLYEKASTPWEWQEELKAEAERIGLDFLSTPFDKSAVDFLEKLDVGFYKIASFELVDLPFISYVSSKGKPILLSTGMGTKEEIREAAEAVWNAGNDQLILLKCSSVYPAVLNEMNLNTIQDMKQTFGTKVGLSDHTLGSLSAAAAVALGASVIEKHFCISRTLKSPDSEFSMEPAEYKKMAQTIRQVEEALGEARYGPSEQEEGSLVFRRSVFAVKQIKKGETLTKENIKIIRPGYGLKPKYYQEVLGKTVKGDVKEGTPLQWDMFLK